MPRIIGIGGEERHRICNIEAQKWRSWLISKAAWRQAAGGGESAFSVSAAEQIWAAAAAWPASWPSNEAEGEMAGGEEGVKSAQSALAQHLRHRRQSAAQQRNASIMAYQKENKQRLSGKSWRLAYKAASSAKEYQRHGIDAIMKAKHRRRIESENHRMAWRPAAWRRQRREMALRRNQSPLARVRWRKYAGAGWLASAAAASAA